MTSTLQSKGIIYFLVLSFTLLQVAPPGLYAQDATNYSSQSSSDQQYITREEANEIQFAEENEIPDPYAYSPISSDPAVKAEAEARIYPSQTLKVSVDGENASISFNGQKQSGKFDSESGVVTVNVPGFDPMTKQIWSLGLEESNGTYTISKFSNATERTWRVIEDPNDPSKSLSSGYAQTTEYVFQDFEGAMFAKEVNTTYTNDSYYVDQNNNLNHTEYVSTSTTVNTFKSGIGGEVLLESSRTESKDSSLLNSAFQYRGVSRNQQYYNYDETSKEQLGMLSVYSSENTQQNGETYHYQSAYYNLVDHEQNRRINAYASRENLQDILSSINSFDDYELIHAAADTRNISYYSDSAMTRLSHTIEQEITHEGEEVTFVDRIVNVYQSDYRNTKTYIAVNGADVINGETDDILIKNYQNINIGIRSGDVIRTLEAQVYYSRTYDYGSLDGTEYYNTANAAGYYSEESFLGYGINISYKDPETSQYVTVRLNFPEENEVDVAGRHFRFSLNAEGIAVFEQMEDPRVTAARELAIANLSEALNLSEEQMKDIQVLSIGEQTWNDGCVGFYVPGQACTMAIVNDYRVVLSLYGNTYEMHAGRLSPENRTAIIAIHDLVAQGYRLEDIRVNSSVLESQAMRSKEDGSDVVRLDQAVFSIKLSDGETGKWLYRVNYYDGEIISVTSTQDLIDDAAQQINVLIDAYGVPQPLLSSMVDDAYLALNELQEKFRTVLTDLRERLNAIGWGPQPQDTSGKGDFVVYEWPGPYPQEAINLENLALERLYGFHNDLVNSTLSFKTSEGILVDVPMKDVYKSIRQAFNSNVYDYYGDGYQIYFPIKPADLLAIFGGLTEEMLPPDFSQPVNYDFNIFQMRYYLTAGANIMAYHIGPTDKDLQGIVVKFLSEKIEDAIDENAEFSMGLFMTAIKGKKTGEETLASIRADIAELRTFIDQLREINANKSDNEQKWKELNEILNGRSEMYLMGMPEISPAYYVALSKLEKWEASLAEAIESDNLETILKTREEYESFKMNNYEESMKALEMDIRKAENRTEELPGLIAELELKIGERSEKRRQAVVEILAGYSDLIASHELVDKSNEFVGSLWPEYESYGDARDMKWYTFYAEVQTYSGVLKNGKSIELIFKNGGLDPKVDGELRAMRHTIETAGLSAEFVQIEYPTFMSVFSGGFSVVKGPFNHFVGVHDTNGDLISIHSYSTQYPDPADMIAATTFNTYFDLANMTAELLQASDVDGNGLTDKGDIDAILNRLFVTKSWGDQTADENDAVFDVDRDGVVGVSDALIVLASIHYAGQELRRTLLNSIEEAVQAAEKGAASADAAILAQEKAMEESIAAFTQSMIAETENLQSVLSELRALRDSDGISDDAAGKIDGFLAEMEIFLKEGGTLQDSKETYINWLRAGFQDEINYQQAVKESWLDYKAELLKYEEKVRREPAEGLEDLKKQFPLHAEKPRQMTPSYVFESPIEMLKRNTARGKELVDSVLILESLHDHVKGQRLVIENALKEADEEILSLTKRRDERLSNFESNLSESRADLETAIAALEEIKDKEGVGAENLAAIEALLDEASNFLGEDGELKGLVTEYKQWIVTGFDLEINYWKSVKSSAEEFSLVIDQYEKDVNEAGLSRLMELAMAKPMWVKPPQNMADQMYIESPVARIQELTERAVTLHALALEEIEGHETTKLRGSLIAKADKKLEIARGHITNANNIVGDIRANLHSAIENLKKDLLLGRSQFETELDALRDEVAVFNSGEGNNSQEPYDPTDTADYNNEILKLVEEIHVFISAGEVSLTDGGDIAEAANVYIEALESNAETHIGAILSSVQPMVDFEVEMVSFRADVMAAETLPQLRQLESIFPQEPEIYEVAFKPGPLPLNPKDLLTNKIDAARNLLSKFRDLLAKRDLANVKAKGKALIASIQTWKTGYEATLNTLLANLAETPSVAEAVKVYMDLFETYKGFLELSGMYLATGDSARRIESLLADADLARREALEILKMYGVIVVSNEDGTYSVQDEQGGVFNSHADANGDSSIIVSDLIIEQLKSQILGLENEMDASLQRAFAANDKLQASADVDQAMQHLSGIQQEYYAFSPVLWYAVDGKMVSAEDAAADEMEGFAPFYSFNLAVRNLKSDVSDLISARKSNSANLGMQREKVESLYQEAKNLVDSEVDGARRLIQGLRSNNYDFDGNGKFDTRDIDFAEGLIKSALAVAAWLEQEEISVLDADNDGKFSQAEADALLKKIHTILLLKGLKENATVILTGLLTKLEAAGHPQTVADQTSVNKAESMLWTAIADVEDLFAALKDTVGPDLYAEFDEISAGIQELAQKSIDLVRKSRNANQYLIDRGPDYDMVSDLIADMPELNRTLNRALIEAANGQIVIEGYSGTGIANLLSGVESEDVAGLKSSGELREAETISSCVIGEVTGAVCSMYYSSANHELAEGNELLVNLVLRHWDRVVMATDPANGDETPSLKINQEAFYRALLDLPDNLPPQLTDIRMATLAKEDENPEAVDISSLFTDPDGDELIYTANSPDTDFVTVTMDGARLKMDLGSNRNGKIKITITATDPKGESVSTTMELTVEAVNDAPTITPFDTGAMVEGETISFPVTIADVDDDVLETDLTLVNADGTASEAPAWASLLQDTASGEYILSFSPGFDDAGTHRFAIHVRDGESETVHEFEIIVEDKMDTLPPIKVNTKEDTSSEIPFHQDDTLGTIVLMGGPANGSVEKNTDGVYVYTPNADFNGEDSLTYEIHVGDAVIGKGIVQFAVEAVNDAPVAKDRKISSKEDLENLNIGFEASDVDGDDLSAVIVKEPEHGTLTLINGNFIYNSDKDYNGPDWFTYKVNDGTIDSNVATVFLEVLPVNDAPVVESVSGETEVETGTAAEFAVEASDVDGDSLNIVGIVYDEDQKPVDEVSAYNGIIRWDTADHAPGFYRLDVLVSDGEADVMESIQFEVFEYFNVVDYREFRNALGSQTGDDNFNKRFDLDRNGLIDNADYLKFRERYKENSILIALKDAVRDSASQGVYEAGLDFNADGVVNNDDAQLIESIPVIDNEIFEHVFKGIMSLVRSNLGNDSAGYLRAFDADLSGKLENGDYYAVREALTEGRETADFYALNLDIVNIFAEIAEMHKGDMSGSDYLAYYFDLNFDNKVDETDVDLIRNVLLIGDDKVVFEEVEQYKAVVNALLGFVSAAAQDPSSAGSAQILAMLDFNADGQITKGGPLDQEGPDGDVRRAYAALTEGRDVQFIPEPPRFEDVSVNAGETLRVDGVLLELFAASGLPEADMVLVNEDGSETDLPEFMTILHQVDDMPDFPTGLDLAPATGDVGSYTVRYKLKDWFGEGSRDFKVTVKEAVNQKPVINDTEYEGNEDTKITGTLNASDPNGDNITFRIVSEADPRIALNENGDFEITPDENYNGFIAFQVVASDGVLESEPATITIRVNPVNDAPVIADRLENGIFDEDAEALTIDVAPGFSDVDGDELTYSAVSSNPDIVKVSVYASQLYVEFLENQHGTADITVTAKDPSGETVSMTFSATVNPVNDAPVLVLKSYPYQSVNMGEDLTLEVEASDVDGDDLDYTFFLDGEAIDLASSFDAATGKLIWKVTDVAAGNHSLQIVASDKEFDDSATIALNVIDPAANQPPVIDDLQNITMTPNKVTYPVTSEQINFTVGATDPEGEAVTFAMSFEPAPSAAVAAGLPPAPIFDAATNTFKWQPSTRDAGIYHVTFTATDAAGNKSQKTVQITVEDPAVCRTTSTYCQNLKTWVAEGTAAGANMRYEVDGKVYDGIVYGNRDRKHAFKQSPELNMLNVMEGWHSPYTPYKDTVLTITNSSTSGSTPLSNGAGTFLLSQWGADTQLKLARANMIHVSPEHRTHDKGTNYEDATPGIQADGMITSQGSSGSEGNVPRYLMEAAAAMSPETQRALASNGMMARVMQMLVRQNYKADGTNVADYYSGSAHPSVFNTSRVNGAGMIADAHALTYGYLPPEIGIEVLSHNLDEGAEILPNGDKNTAIYETSTSAAFVKRGTAENSVFIVKPEIDLYDGSVENAEIKVAVTRGTATVEDLGDGTYRVTIPHQGMQPANDPTGILSARVDIAFFAVGKDAEGNEVASAPSYLSLNHPRNADYEYADGKLQSIVYRSNYWQHNNVDGYKVGIERLDFHYDGNELTGYTVIDGPDTHEFTHDGLVVIETDAQGRVTVARKATIVPDSNSVLHVSIGDDYYHFSYENGDRQLTKVEVRENDIVIRAFYYLYGPNGNLESISVKSVSSGGVETDLALITPSPNPGVVKIESPDGKLSFHTRFEDMSFVVSGSADAVFQYITELGVIAKELAEREGLVPEDLILNMIYASASPETEPYQGYLGNLQVQFTDLEGKASFWAYAWSPRNYPADLFPGYEPVGFHIALATQMWPYICRDYNLQGELMGTHEYDHEDRMRAKNIAAVRFQADFPGVANVTYTIKETIGGGFDESNGERGKTFDPGLAAGYLVSVTGASGNVLTEYVVMKRSFRSDVNGAGIYSTSYTWRVRTNGDTSSRIEDYDEEGNLLVTRKLVFEGGSITRLTSETKDGAITTVSLTTLLPDLYSPGTAVVTLASGEIVQVSFSMLDDLLDQLNVLEGLL